jgi:hypothetical protein
MKNLLRVGCDLLGILFWVMVWLFFSHLVVTKGGLWSACSDNVSGLRKYSLQHQLFTQSPSSVNTKLLVVGDPMFIDQFRNKHGVQEKVNLVSIPAFNYSDVDEVLNAFNGKKIDKLLIQSSPHLWSDYWYKHDKLDTSIWDRYERNNFAFLSDFKMLLSFTTDCVVPNSTKSEDVSRPKSLFAAQYSDAPRLANNMLRSIKAHFSDLSNVGWVVDKQHIPKDASSELLDAFDEKKAQPGFIPQWGHVVESVDSINLTEWVNQNVR